MLIFRPFSDQFQREYGLLTDHGRRRRVFAEGFQFIHYQKHPNQTLYYVEKHPRIDSRASLVAIFFELAGGDEQRSSHFYSFQVSRTIYLLTLPLYFQYTAAIIVYCDFFYFL